MRYRIDDDTLIVEGKFDAISSGLKGGWKEVGSIFNHTVSDDFCDSDPIHYLETVAERLGLKNYFGLLTSVPMDKLAIVKKDEVTAFVTAGVKNPNEVIGTINIILIIDAGPSDGAMVNAIITATEAKSHTLLEMGYSFTGTNTDAVVVARTGGRYYEYAGPASDLGSKIWYCVKRGVSESLGRW
ncbi:adenosylcobinamide amidohydrolase [Geoglobus acetivorans]|uniref:Adenosylcobinamide amidohydrolase n=1 Tax=Geoglobus acetivorans TaxID=565033 RepID=A0ABZ3H4D2_GEOAI|nr:adenosylcobinamide amidohydrolase [Geoglobus acetivorans]